MFRDLNRLRISRRHCSIIIIVSRARANPTQTSIIIMEQFSLHALHSFGLIMYFYHSLPSPLSFIFSFRSCRIFLSDSQVNAVLFIVLWEFVIYIFGLRFCHFLFLFFSLLHSGAKRSSQWIMRSEYSYDHHWIFCCCRLGSNRSFWTLFSLPSMLNAHLLLGHSNGFSMQSMEIRMVKESVFFMTT